MAERDASQVQLDDPQLTADIIAALRLTGTLGLFNLSDTVIPVISVGDVRPPTFSFTPVTFTSAQAFSGSVLNPAANTIIADTGALPAGTYDVVVQMSLIGNTAAMQLPFVCEHRNAANAATLAELLHLGSSDTRTSQSGLLPVFGYVIALNERLRLKSPPALNAGALAGTIFAALRPTP